MGGLLTVAAQSVVWGSELTSNYAAPPPAQPATVYRNPLREVMRVDLDVLVDGQPVKLISHDGRLYLPVPRIGTEYTIRVNNHGPRRIEAVVSVDGLSVINGRPASEKSIGYLVNANSHIVIKGWRRDKETVAAFTFENRENSYAARMGYRDNIGVIGLVAFEEQEVRRLEDLPRTFAVPSKDKRDSATPGGTGTGWGREIGSSVVEVPFVRSANKQTVTIYYDTPEALRRLGVPVDGWNPKPFPADTEYAPPPPKH
jgi:hypothetical protein